MTEETRWLGALRRGDHALVHYWQPNAIRCFCGVVRKDDPRLQRLSGTDLARIPWRPCRKCGVPTIDAIAKVILPAQPQEVS